MAVDRVELRRSWDEVVRAIASAQGISASDAIYQRLLAAYTATTRHYHSITHIAQCLAELEQSRTIARNVNALAAAIWLHDVIYDGRRNDNEEQSADLAERELQTLGSGESLRREVRRLILLTRHDRAPADEDIDGKLIVDIDLSSLALAPEQFDRNTDLIRQEYSHLTEQQYQRGRKELLKRFLERPRIYFTPSYYNRLEQQARQNLERAIKRLDVE